MTSGPTYPVAPTVVMPIVSAISKAIELMSAAELHIPNIIEALSSNFISPLLIELDKSFTDVANLPPGS